MTLFYAGQAEIELHRTETASYRDNLVSGAPALWIVLRPSTGEPPYEILAVTADPAEGEGFTDAGNNLAEPVPMPADIAWIIGRFVAEHHVARMASDRVARLARHLTACSERSGLSASTGCSNLIYASISIRFHTPTCGRFSTNESKTASSDG